MKEPLPLDGNELIKWWLNHPEGSRALYHPQGYEGLTSEDDVTELYVTVVIDLDLEIFYCISVRHRPYLNGVTVNGKIPEDMEEVRDHLFVAVELLLLHPEQKGPITHHEWMNRPHHPFDEDSPTPRETMNAFMDFIEGLQRDS